MLTVSKPLVNILVWTIDMYMTLTELGVIFMINLEVNKVQVKSILLPSV